jgi:hypothetical protein
MPAAYAEPLEPAGRFPDNALSRYAALRTSSK